MIRKATDADLVHVANHWKHGLRAIYVITPSELSWPAVQQWGDVGGPTKTTVFYRESLRPSRKKEYGSIRHHNSLFVAYDSDLRKELLRRELLSCE